MEDSTAGGAPWWHGALLYQAYVRPGSVLASSAEGALRDGVLAPWAGVITRRASDLR